MLASSADEVLNSQSPFITVALSYANAVAKGMEFQGKLLGESDLVGKTLSKLGEKLGYALGITDICIKGEAFAATLVGVGKNIKEAWQEVDGNISSFYDLRLFLGEIRGVNSERFDNVFHAGIDFAASFTQFYLGKSLMKKFPKLEKSWVGVVASAAIDAVVDFSASGFHDLYDWLVGNNEYGVDRWSLNTPIVNPVFTTKVKENLDNVNYVPWSTGYSYNINNTDTGVVVSGTAFNDYISNSGNNVNIYAGMGNDKIYNDGNNVNIYAGAGNNFIEAGGAYVVLGGGRNTVSSGNITSSANRIVADIAILH